MSDMARTLILVILLFTVGCQQKPMDEQSKENELSPQQPARSNSLNVPKKNAASKQSSYRGTVKFLNFEGGFYGIVTQKGQKLLPTNLPKEYQQAGAMVEISGVYLKDTLTIQQWGSPFRIDKIKLIKAGKNPGALEI